MKALKERILRDGKCFEGGILESKTISSIHQNGSYPHEIHCCRICTPFRLYQYQ